MDAVIALIAAGAIFRTDGTWPLTRLVSVVMVPFAIAADFLPTAVALAPIKPWAWAAFAVLWFINVSQLRGVRSSS